MQRGEVWWVEFDPAGGNHRQQQRCQLQSVPRHRRAIDQQPRAGLSDDGCFELVTSGG